MSSSSSSSVSSSLRRRLFASTAAVEDDGSLGDEASGTVVASTTAGGPLGGAREGTGSGGGVFLGEAGAGAAAGFPEEPVALLLVSGAPRLVLEGDREDVVGRGGGTDLLFSPPAGDSPEAEEAEGCRFRTEFAPVVDEGASPPPPVADGPPLPLSPVAS